MKSIVDNPFGYAKGCSTIHLLRLQKHRHIGGEIKTARDSATRIFYMLQMFQGFSEKKGGIQNVTCITNGGTLTAFECLIELVLLFHCRALCLCYPPFLFERFLPLFSFLV